MNPSDWCYFVDGLEVAKNQATFFQKKINSLCRSLVLAKKQRDQFHYILMKLLEPYADQKTHEYWGPELLEEARAALSEGK